MLRSDSVSGTTNPVPVSAWVMAARGYEVAIVAMDVYAIDESKCAISGFSDWTTFAVTCAGVAQITLSTDKLPPLENLRVKGPEPEMLVMSLPCLTDERGNA